MDARTYLEHLIDGEIPSAARVAGHRKGLAHWAQIREGRQGIGGDDIWEGAKSAESLFRLQTEAVNALIVPFIVAEAIADHPDLDSDIRSVPVGVLPVRSVNGKVLLAPSGDPVIVIDSGLIATCSFLMESFLYAPVLGSTNPAGADLLRNTTLRFVTAYYEREFDLNFPYPLEIPRHFALTATVFCQALEAFVIAHEFAHICAGHVSGLSARRSRLLSGRAVEELPRDADQEFEADELAWTWFQRASTKLPFLDALKPEFREIAPLYLFVVLQCAYQNVSDYASLDTHPAPLERLRKLVERCGSGRPKELAQEIERYCSAIGKLAPFSGADDSSIRNECEILNGVALGTMRALVTLDGEGSGSSRKMPVGGSANTIADLLARERESRYYYDRGDVSYAVTKRLADVIGSTSFEFDERLTLAQLGMNWWTWSSLMIELDDRFGLNRFWLESDPSWRLLRPQVTLGILIDYVWRRVLQELKKPFPDPHPDEIIRWVTTEF